MLSFFLFLGVSSGPPVSQVARWAQVRQQALQEEKRGDLSSAEQSFVKALELAAHGPASERFTSLEDLGRCYWKANNPRSAEPYFRSALAIMDSTVDSDSASRPIAYNNLATVLRYTGAFDEAERLIWRAIHAYQRLGEMVEVSRCYVALAEIHISRGDSERSASDLKTAVEVLNSSHSDGELAGSTLVWIAENDLVLNRMADAEAAIDGGGAMLERLLPPNSAAVISLLDTRGALLFRRMHYAEAERVWSDALSRASKAGLFAASTAIHLGQLYCTLGQYQKAEEAFGALVENVNSSLHTRAVAETELAWAVFQDGQTDRAESLFRSAMADLNAVGLTDCTPVATLCARYAQLHMRRKDWNEALPLLQRAIRIGQKTASPQTREWLLQCADICKRMGDKKAASDYKEQAQALRPAEGPARATVDIRELQAAAGRQ